MTNLENKKKNVAAKITGQFTKDFLESNRNTKKGDEAYARMSKKHHGKSDHNFNRDMIIRERLKKGHYTAGDSRAAGGR